MVSKSIHFYFKIAKLKPNNFFEVYSLLFSMNFQRVQISHFFGQSLIYLDIIKLYHYLSKCVSHFKRMPLFVKQNTMYSWLKIDKIKIHCNT